MKISVITALASVTLLSLLDFMFDYSMMPKSALFAIIWVVCVLAFWGSSYFLITDFKFESNYFRLLFFAYFIYGVATVVRGWSFANADLTTFLRVPYIFWPYLMPLFAFFDKRFYTMAFLMDGLYFLGIVFLVVAIGLSHLLLFRPSAEPLVFALALGCEFLLLNALYLGNQKTNIAFLVLSVATLSLIYLARRAAASLFIGVIVFSYILSLFSKPKPKLFKVLPLIVIAGAIVFFTVGDFSKSLTDNLDKRLKEDTRTNVTDYFMTDMKNDMTWGKGMNGRYYCPIGGGGVHEDGMEYNRVEYRDTIENGYLHIVLSGGIVHMVMFLLICIPAAFSGIFRSSNQFTRSCGVIILMWLVYMFGFGQPNLSLGYMLVWIAIGVCFKSSLRKMSDLEVMLALSDVKVQLVPDVE